MTQRFFLTGILLLSLTSCSDDDSESTTDARRTEDAGKTPDAGPDVPTTKVDRSGLTDLGDAPIDYSDGNYWACRPGNDPNECYGDLDATVFTADGESRVDKLEPATAPEFDCFYVYPTVDLTSPGNTNSFADLSAIRDPLLSQGAPFRQICRVYAPLYRQQAISTETSMLVGDADLAFGDVEAAFDEYLDNWNDGRKFVLIGHSQGTFMLQRLIIERLETDDALRSQMISAVLLGGLPQVPNGEEVGGSFSKVPACTEAGQTGCVIAYNSFAAESPPPEAAFFGRGSEVTESTCTTPGPLANRSARSQGAYFAKTINVPLFESDIPEGSLPEFDTPFAAFPSIFRGECVREAIGGAPFHYLKITLDPPSGDERTVPPYRSSILEQVAFGLHLADFSLFLDDLIEAVRLQADAALQ